LDGINKEPGSRGGSKQPSTRTGRSTGRRWRLAGRREEREGNAVRTCGLAVEAGCEGVEATADWNHEIRWNGHAGHQVLVYERLLLQLLVLRRRERHHRPRGRPPRARLGVLLPQPAAPAPAHIPPRRHNTTANQTAASMGDDTTRAKKR
jgi:hypothetical protein